MNWKEHINLKLFESGEKIIKAMRPAEKMVFRFLVTVMAVTSFLLLAQVHQLFLVEVPAFGGNFVEGVVGSPRFINPVLAISDTDKDISALVYAGLLKTSANGSYVPDLAESYSISADGTEYDFHIKGDALFHDNHPVTSDDVIFTIEKALDPSVKSPKRANWEGVAVEKVSDKEIRFVLKKPYAPFMEALTLGILPKHLWDSATSEEFPFSQWNVSPIGAGPYKIENIKRNSAGIPTSITLVVSNKYPSDRPHIKSIIFKFFQNEVALLKAYEAEEVEAIAHINPEAVSGLRAGVQILTTSLPRMFAVFLNQNAAPVLLNKEVRQALDMAAPKDQMVYDILGGFGAVAVGPLPSQTRSALKEALDNTETAKALLTEAGWKLDETDSVLKKKTKSETQSLMFAISTSDSPDLKQAALILKQAWEKLGARVEIKVFEAGDLNQNVIRPRKYDALLFGEVVNTESDLYPFWHSSQRVDPGLNISLYANIATDKLLEELRAESDLAMREAKRQNLSAEIMKDVPAIFLFVPDLVYLPAPKIKNISLKSVSAPSERFSSEGNWFIETDKVWKFLDSWNL